MDDGRYGVPVDAANRPQPKAAPQPLLVSAGEAGRATPPPTWGWCRGHVRKPYICLETGRPGGGDLGSPAENESVTIASGKEEIDAWERTIATQLRRPEVALASTGIEALGLDAGDALGAWADHHDRARVAVPPARRPPPARSRAPARRRRPTGRAPSHDADRIPPGLFTKRSAPALHRPPTRPAAASIDDPQLRNQRSCDRAGASAVQGPWDRLAGAGLHAPNVRPQPIPPAN